ncbi:MAG: UDP-N-acetylmuramoyl-L-alanine--D-glutamate ligase [Acetobacteraceae bacterium]
MRVDELRGRRVAIWGYAREGRAALRFLRERDPGLAITVLDDAPTASDADAPLIGGRDAIAAAIGGFDVVVKSPGISLYDPLVVQAKAAGVRFTSLLNLWFADAPACRTICVTGTKGKSTTTALLAHMLRGVGWHALAAGNIGIPVTDLPSTGLDAAVIEVSSYQAADFAGTCDIAVLTSLSQEHLDWHGGVAAYRRDKLNLLRHARLAIANADARDIVLEDGGALDGVLWFDPEAPVAVANRYLARPHNRSNLSAALTVIRTLGLDAAAALRSAENFEALAHRQQEIGEVGGVLFVDDSISTTPESAIAALDVYRGRALTVIIGGHDRGIDYGTLVDRLRAAPRPGVVLMDASGRRIHGLLGSAPCVRLAESMHEAVVQARAMTPPGGVVLLSPAAPSYGRYRSFIERGEDFARCAGVGARRAQDQ